MRRHPAGFGLALALHGAAAVAGLVAPRVLGSIVQAVQNGTTDRSRRPARRPDRRRALVVQTVLTRYARFASVTLGERVLADLREDFVEKALDLPVGVVESAGQRRPAEPHLA